MTTSSAQSAASIYTLVQVSRYMYIYSSVGAGANVPKDAEDEAASRGLCAHARELTKLFCNQLISASAAATSSARILEIYRLKDSVVRSSDCGESSRRYRGFFLAVGENSSFFF